jgi:hypothetical protein
LLMKKPSYKYTTRLLGKNVRSTNVAKQRMPPANVFD